MGLVIDAVATTVLVRYDTSITLLVEAALKAYDPSLLKLVGAHRLRKSTKPGR